MTPLAIAARHGPWVLLLGLVVGIALPALAASLRPWLPMMVMALLFLATLRLEPEEIDKALDCLPRTIGVVLVLQLALPLTVIAIGFITGLQNTPVFLALILMTSASSISGSPNMMIMLGHGPGPAMRLLVAGTTLLPLTILPILWLLPDLGSISSILTTAGKLFLAIALATLAAILIRRNLVPKPSSATLENLDGVSAIVLAVFVVALMPAVSFAFHEKPQTTLLWLLLVFIANFGLQVVMVCFNHRRLPDDEVTAIALVAGNRNIALFLVALPSEVIAPIMVFIGCYQIPMYLTPLLMQRLYRLAV